MRPATIGTASPYLRQEAHICYWVADDPPPATTSATRGWQMLSTTGYARACSRLLKKPATCGQGWQVADVMEVDLYARAQSRFAEIPATPATRRQP